MQHKELVAELQNIFLAHENFGMKFMDLMMEVENMAGQMLREHDIEDFPLLVCTKVDNRRNYHVVHNISQLIKLGENGSVNFCIIHSNVDTLTPEQWIAFMDASYESGYTLAKLEEDDAHR